MPKIERLKSLQAKLRQAKYKFGREKQASVIVGYTAAYALYVHENVEMKLQGQPRRGGSKKGRYWDPQGKAQAKFLEQPAREMQPELGAIISTAVAKGATVAQALLIAGLRLQRESQKLVPVDTGNLKNSAFTRKE